MSNPKQAWSVVHALQDSLRDGRSNLEIIPDLIVRVVDDELWREFYCEPTQEVVSHASFAAYVTKGVPDGLGTTIQTLKNLCRDRTDALDAIDRATKQASKPGERRDLLDNVQEVVTDPPTGNTAEAALRRLRKDRPDLHEQVIKGELTPNAAAIEAGFRKKQISVPVGDAASAARRLLKHYERAELIEAIQLSGHTQ